MRTAARARVRTGPLMRTSRVPRSPPPQTAARPPARTAPKVLPPRPSPPARTAPRMLPPRPSPPRPPARTRQPERPPTAGFRPDRPGDKGVSDRVRRIAPGMSYCCARYAQDEDPLRRQEALQSHRLRQGARQARLHEPHPREEVAQAQARAGPPGDSLRARHAACQEAAGSRQMTRVKRSLNARKKRRSTLEQTKGFRGQAHSNYKRAKEALMKADAYAYRDRRNRKRDFRRLWITRINAAARQNGMSYSQVMHGLMLAGVELDRKVLADIAVRDADTFRRFVEVSREAAASSEPAREASAA